jgi:hypothetical protein
MRRTIALTCLLPLLAGCVSVELGGADAVPRCDAGVGVDRASDPFGSSHAFSSPVVLMAQSVPTASMVPCVDALPPGWNFVRLDATEHGARFWLSSDRNGERAVQVAIDRVCDVRGAAESISDQPGTTRFERVDPVQSGYRGARYYRFDGGCVTYSFDLRGTADAQPVDAVSHALGFVTRDVLRRMVHDYSDGRFELDPTPTPVGSR